MEFKKAYEALKQGALIKCPEWRGYWKWEDNSIKMHCKDGKTLDIRETKNVGYTLDFILRDDWEIVDEADVKDLDVQTFTFGEAIRRLKIGQKVARKGWNGKKQYIQLATGISYVSTGGEIVNCEHDAIGNKAIAFVGTSGVQMGWLAVFISRLWQIHIFGEGNTRTTAVFFIKYLRTLGFAATNDIFAENAWYFRNALVRANYTNLQKGIYETTEYLELFLRNLLLNEQNELQNRNLHISGLLNKEKVDIQGVKVDIQDAKVDIESVLSAKGSDFTVKTTVHIHRLFEKFGLDGVFGRSAVMELLELKSSGASKLLSNLVQADIIEPVSGHGKGKYKFKK